MYSMVIVVRISTQSRLYLLFLHHDDEQYVRFRKTNVKALITLDALSFLFTTM